MGEHVAAAVDAISVTLRDQRPEERVDLARWPASGARLLGSGSQSGSTTAAADLAHHLHAKIVNRAAEILRLAGEIDAEGHARHDLQRQFVHLRRQIERCARRPALERRRVLSTIMDA